MLSFRALCLADTPHVHEIYRFPNGTWIENNAVRRNGNLLLTLLSTPEVWEVEPWTQSGNNTAQLVHHFEGAEDVDGITELSPDIYAVIASNSVWTIDLGDDRTKIKPVLTPRLTAGFLNGMAALDEGQAVAITELETRSRMRVSISALANTMRFTYTKAWLQIVTCDC